MLELDAGAGHVDGGGLDPSLAFHLHQQPIHLNLRRQVLALTGREPQRDEYSQKVLQFLEPYVSLHRDAPLAVALPDSVVPCGGLSMETVA